MISNDDYSADGTSLQHNTGNNGSMYMVRVGSRRLPLYPLVIMCLALLNTILMLAAVVIGFYCGKVSEKSVPYQEIASLNIELRQLRVMHTEAITAHEEAQQELEKELSNHEQLKLQLEQNKTHSDGVQRQLEILQDERATLQDYTSKIRESCGRCQPGWLLYNTSCYFYTTIESDPMTWEDSRLDCIRRGANLAVIDNLEEQVNIFEYLPKLDPSIRPWWKKPGGIWIGLSDIQTEGTWMWINNVTLQEEAFWINGEPNDHTGNEDCAAIMNVNNPTETWFDAFCQQNKGRLCEMEPN